MSIAEDSFKAGHLEQALAALQADIRQEPESPKLRVFLAQLLMVMGRWDRASAQLTVIKEMDVLNAPMALTYGAAIQCEHLRKEVFTGKRSPLILGEPFPWLASLVQALIADADGERARAEDLRGSAFEAAEAAPGSINDTRFQWLADADSRLGPVLEVILNGSYYWVPFVRIQSVTFDPPEDIRDLVWTPGKLAWANGGEAMALIPARYPGTEDAEDDSLRLARKTTWSAVTEDFAFGIGQRTLISDVNEWGLLDLRSLIFDATVS